MKAGVLVDVDGTLVDSNYHHTLAWSRALRDHGERVPLVSIHRSIGMGSTEMLQSLIGRDDDAITDSWREYFNELLPEIVPCLGAAELLRALHGRGFVVVLATSSPEDLIDEYRRKLDADDAIDDVVTSSDVDRAKPNPDVFAVALEKTGLPRERVIVIGDSVWDVEAAEAHRARLRRPRERRGQPLRAGGGRRVRRLPRPVGAHRPAGPQPDRDAPHLRSPAGCARDIHFDDARGLRASCRGNNHDSVIRCNHDRGMNE